MNAPQKSKKPIAIEPLTASRDRIGLDPNRKEHPLNPQLNKSDDPYEIPSLWYDIRGYFILRFAYRVTLRSQVRFFLDLKDPHLEAAIGSGSFFIFVAIWRWITRAPKVNVQGFDLAPQMLKAAQRLFQFSKNINLQVADAVRMPYPDSTFTSIHVANAFHCFPEPLKALNELSRVAKTGCILRINVILEPKGRESLRDKISWWLVHWGQRKGILHKAYQMDELRRLWAQSSWQVETENIAGNCLTIALKKKS